MSVSEAAAAPGVENWQAQHAQALSAENRRLRAEVLDLRAALEVAKAAHQEFDGLAAAIASLEGTHRRDRAGNWYVCREDGWHACDLPGETA